MPRVANKLSTNRDGSFSARKRIPADVQSEYERLYGVRWEERFRGEPGPVLLARQRWREWASTIETRIANIRAERNGDGRMHTPKEARGLAGEWYHWFIARHLAKLEPDDAVGWEMEASDAYDALRETVWGQDQDRWPEGRDHDPFDDLEEEKARRKMRPFVADRAETAQFLHAKQLTLDRAARDAFLDHVCKDYFNALKLLIRRARGDYGKDKYAKSFPVFHSDTDPGLTPWLLFQRWIDDAKPAASTVDRWRAVFLKLQEDFPACATITPEAAQNWARGLINSERSARTVNDVWVIAARTVFGWAKSQRFLVQNSFTEVRITVPRKNTTRESKAFTSDEIKTILRAALVMSEPKTKMHAARRWVPWLCAYTGARGGEIAQLRGADCIHQDGVWAIRITPEAGTTKTKQARTVPLHEHVIAQGFLEFVKRNGTGPLFYGQQKVPLPAADATNPPKARSVKVRERIAEWVRDLGVTDREVQPNHAWRHTFKQVCDREHISERVSDAITGHAPASVGRAYGAPTLKDKADALRHFPRYDIGERSSKTPAVA
jgi:integrase